MDSACILVVEDNIANLKLVEALLKRQGFEVLAASNAQEALAILKKSHPTVILLDLQLPDMDGMQLARLLKKDPDTRHIRIIALTGFVSEQSRNEALACGMSAYLTKPFDIKELMDVIVQQDK